MKEGSISWDALFHFSDLSDQIRFSFPHSCLSLSTSTHWFREFQIDVSFRPLNTLNFRNFQEMKACTRSHYLYVRYAYFNLKFSYPLSESLILKFWKSSTQIIIRKIPRIVKTILHQILSSASILASFLQFMVSRYSFSLFLWQNF